ncbi:MAG: ATP-dependent DNA helicase RecG [Alphaproteobacteria bacterium]|nr:ATP-dependent DNA helicase RecG [Alphaproteobacteria bacterium]
MRPSFLFPLFSNITNISGVGDKTAKLLANLGINKIGDAIWHFPHSFIKRKLKNSLKNATIGEVNTFCVKIIEHIAPQRKSQPYRVWAEDEAGEQISLCFFKVYETSIEKNLPVGEKRYISGKVEKFNNILQMSHPDYITKNLNEIPQYEPVYGLTAGISNKFINKLTNQALQRVPILAEWQEPVFLKQNKFPSFNQAIIDVHNPKNMNDLLPTSLSRTRLAYDELLANQLALAIVRQKVKKQKGRKIAGNGLLRKKVIDALPFRLTDAQETVLKEIFADQSSDSRMLRLLQGDVGSGKTIVALLTMLNAVECGYQATIMAPTEILAKQHFESIAPICETIGIRAELLIGKTKGKTRAAIIQDLADGKIDILIGTHALFVEDVTFKDLACVIIDEQHRFGVHQRLNLANKGNKADILVMTATPIPRSLILTAFGDMEYSKITQLPEGRKPVDTRVMPLNKADDIIAALKSKLDNGTRAYWVCPLVEESEKIDLAAAEKRFKYLQDIFGDKVGIIHGKMKEKQKDEIMEQFKSGKINLLVATTVIEVGVNVPEATIIIIEHAERFGLAQLHQLRGRVKRGNSAASCLLLYGFPLSDTARARLKIMKDTEDGFLIAEEDLKLRGSGEILGTKQSGFSNFKIADMSVHQKLLITANKDAKMIIEQDIDLKSPRGEALRTLLYLFEKDDAVKTYLAG